jgi:uncharacterized HAD superfamily protein/hypoxanthine phosphoribosyltransferase
MLEYRSVADINRILLSNLEVFRQNADLVVGVPRSGMLPAVLLALHLDVPVADLSSYCRGHVAAVGARLAKRESQTKDSVPERRRVLIVDDSIRTGTAMRMARAQIASSLPESIDLLKFAAVYVVPGKKTEVDIWCEELPDRVFEWNILNGTILTQSCVDIDGVLCRNPTEYENDDGSEYRRFISTVAPLRVPPYEVGWLVTSRLEKYRPLTEEWLASSGIRYRQLMMLDLPSKEARIAANAHSHFKAEVYGKTESVLFIESDLCQARDIAGRCRKPVYCVETGEMVYHDDVATLVRRDRRLRGLWRGLRPLVPACLRPFARRTASLLRLR